MNCAPLIRYLAFFVAAGVEQAEGAHSPRIAAGQEFSCLVPRGFQVVKTTAEIPRALLGREEFQGIAMLGEKWNAGDVMGGPEPSTDVEFVLHRGKRWIVMFGHGGIATSPETRAYDLTEDASKATDVTPPDTNVQTSCDMVERSAQRP